MKHLYLLLFTIFFTFQIHAQNAPFITTWQVPTLNLSITIPTIGSGYNYTVDFGDGTTLTNQTGNATHTYATHGVYTVTISGDFPRIYFFNSSDRQKILSVEQWGDIAWSSMQGAFYSCSNLVINATDAPDLSQVTDMSNMFRNCHSLNQPINHWNVSNVTNMMETFRYASTFNQTLNNWNVSNVTNMEGMFWEAVSFNELINNWNVSNVMNMGGMFYYANSFNQPLNDWDVLNVENMERLFYNATSFNQPLNGWDVSNVQNMAGMFRNATSFNQPLDNWDVSNVSVFNKAGIGANYIGGMFQNANSFNQPINNWDVSNATDMTYMFRNASSFNQSLDSWDMSNMVNLGAMFEGASSFNGSINNWDVSNVESMGSMFKDATSFNQPINSWDVSNVITMYGMFRNATSFNQSINSWDVSKVEYMDYMFESATSFNQSINSWDVSSLKRTNFMFQYANAFNQPLNDWNFLNIESINYMFRGAISFNQPLDNWNITNIADELLGVFREASSFNQDLSGWNYRPANTSGIRWYLSFIAFSGMDVWNYQALLNRFAQLEISNGNISANDLKYCDETARNYLINTLNWTISNDIYSPDCNFVNGAIVFDENNNGCDPNDIGVTGFMVNAFDGTNNWITSSNNGIYNLAAYGTNFTVSVVNQPSYFTVTPASVPVTFTTSQTEIVDFCVTANQSIEDLNITLIPPSEARPGFDADYRLVVRNVGTKTIINVEATLAFDDLMQQFVSANPAPGTTTTNTLTFPIGSMQPFQTVEIDITMLTFQPPTVNGDDILNFTATATPVANDHTPIDNTFNLAQIVVNSYDPNDKQVLQGEELHIDHIDEYLDYLIRFQNTGTASAINVRILDTLHPKLDWSTLTPISASHDYYVKITEGNRVEFMFDNIHLPDSLSNEPESHGFVAYKIKPKSNLQVGDVISGDAAIYFDFNAPIITNMVYTEIVNPLSITDVSNPLNRVVLYPNPTNKTLHIHLTEGIELEQVLIYDLQGKEVQKIQGKETTLDVEHLRSGMYLLKITTNRGTINRQLIKN